MPITLPPINRRQFFTGMVSNMTAMDLWLTNILGAETRKPSSDVFAFLSDTHISADRNKEGGKEPIKPLEHLSKVCNDILSGKIEMSDCLIHCGDCAYQQGLPEDYTTLLEKLIPIRQSGIAVHFALGNHDKRDVFLKSIAKADRKPEPKIIPTRHHFVLEMPKANFFLLDSIPASFGQAQLQWLAEELDSRRDKPAILVAHHYPDYTRNFVKNPHALQDTNEFFETIKNRKQVKAYIFGHSHSWKTLQKYDIHLINIPAVAWRFDPLQPYGWVLAQLKDNGILLTLRSLDPNHPKHNEVVDLIWR